MGLRTHGITKDMLIEHKQRQDAPPTAQPSPEAPADVITVIRVVSQSCIV